VSCLPAEVDTGPIVENFETLNVYFVVQQNFLMLLVAKILGIIFALNIEMFAIK